MKSIIKLFKAVPIKDKTLGVSGNEWLSKTVREGFIFSNEVYGNYSGAELDQLLEEVKKEIGFNSQQANSSFHKSWQKVRDADIEQLVLEQVIHYLTTYGFEELGIYNEESVYIPNIMVPETWT